jgi:hypothetical protein
MSLIVSVHVVIARAGHLARTMAVFSYELLTGPF